MTEKFWCQEHGLLEDPWGRLWPAWLRKGCPLCASLRADGPRLAERRPIEGKGRECDE